VDEKSIAMKIFDRLCSYLSTHMKMSHVYQPIMIKHLLENGGNAKANEIAIDLVQNDLSQIEYYTERVNAMVGKVLRKNEVVSKVKDDYFLVGYENLTEEERHKLILACSEKIEQYKIKRGILIWDHRRKNRKPIDGSIRYQVLNRANNVCELCGISSTIKALEVDHIVPKNWNGPDDLSNYQALCYQCNSNKRDTDDTDFRERGLIFEERAPYGDCRFCDLQNGKVVIEKNLALCLEDDESKDLKKFFILPKRHVLALEDLKSAELNSIHLIIKELKSQNSNNVNLQCFESGARHLVFELMFFDSYSEIKY
jgi:ATP adenylyltransferase